MKCCNQKFINVTFFLTCPSDSETFYGLTTLIYVLLFACRQKPVIYRVSIARNCIEFPHRSARLSHWRQRDGKRKDPRRKKIDFPAYLII